MLLKRAAGIAKASAVPHKDKIGKVTRAQVREIAQTKLVDLNTDSIESAMRTIEGTARSMGIEVVRCEAKPKASRANASEADPMSSTNGRIR